MLWNLTFSLSLILHLKQAEFTLQIVVTNPVKRILPGKFYSGTWKGVELYFFFPYPRRISEIMFASVGLLWGILGRKNKSITSKIVWETFLLLLFFSQEIPVTAVILMLK